MSPIADYIITNKITSVGASRKIFNSIGMNLCPKTDFNCDLSSDNEETCDFKHLFFDIVI